MDDLLAKLREAIDEDERIALQAAGPKAIWTSWETSEFFGYETPHVQIGCGSSRHPLSGGHFTYRPVDKRFADHIVRHDPARVLRQVAAHREILDMVKVSDEGDVTVEISGETLCDDWCLRAVGEYLLRTMAQAHGIEVPVEAE